MSRLLPAARMTINPRDQEGQLRLGSANWLGLVAWALFFRIAAADLVQWWADRRHVLCLFPDTTIYWGLATKVVNGEPFEVTFWGDLPHFALRTPGYPLFLAACQWLFGARALPARLVQSLLGALCVVLVARLVARTLPEKGQWRGWPIPFVAAAFTAFDPFVISNSAFLLSEALFLPLMLLAQWAFAELWTSTATTRWRPAWALLTGVVSGAAVLVRPSWSLYLPLLLAFWLLMGRGSLLGKLGGSAWVVVGLVLIMAPWWVRNAGIHGKFVPTALWMGASLYDGINPHATGASDMGFLNDPEFWPLDEEAQDQLLSARAIAFARENPGRVARLAVVKAGRFWSPWPNAEAFASPWVALSSCLVVLPIFGLTAVGIWRSRHDNQALVLLGLPLLYTFALHLLFVSSMRYRIPVFVPAFGFTALACSNLLPNRKPIK